MTLPSRRGVRAPLCALLLVVVALVAGCSAAEPERVAGGEQVSGEQVSGEQRLRVDGRDRSYELRPATGLAEGEKAAVVVVLHQEGGTPSGVAEETELASLTEQGATLVYPAGIDTSWDAGGCCGLPNEQGVDDVAFLDAVLKDVADKTPVDLDRAALVGYSSGGMLAYRYVCAQAGQLAAAVVVSGSLEAPCEGDIEVPDVLTLHGKLDGTIGLEKSAFVKALGLEPKPLSKTLKEITTSAGCGAPQLVAENDEDVYRWSGCRGGGLVEARLIAGAGHGWGQLGASQRTAEFLKAQLLQG